MNFIGEIGGMCGMLLGWSVLGTFIIILMFLIVIFLKIYNIVIFIHQKRCANINLEGYLYQI